ncbi:zinc finger, CCHC-type containing protein [Tanacetum coccineum]
MIKTLLVSTKPPPTMVQPVQSGKQDVISLKSVLIWRIQGIGYGVLGFLGVGTTFDIFQNIHILYLQYGVLDFWIWRIDHASFVVFERGDGVAGFKRRCRDLSSDGVIDLTMASGDVNPIRTLGDYSRPSHEGYRNTIELPEGNNVVPLRSDTIRLVQNGCSFHGLRSEDPNQHLKDFLKLVDSLDLDVANRERTRLRSISTWEDLTTRLLAQFFLPGRTAKVRNDILLFQQHQGESLSEAWT